MGIWGNGIPVYTGGPPVHCQDVFGGLFFPISTWISPTWCSRLFLFLLYAIAGCGLIQWCFFWMVFQDGLSGSWLNRELPDAIHVIKGQYGEWGQ